MRSKIGSIFLISILFIVTNNAMEDESLGIESFLTTVEPTPKTPSEPAPEAEFLTYETVTEEIPEPEPTPVPAAEPIPETISEPIPEPTPAPVYEQAPRIQAPSTFTTAAPAPIMPPSPLQGFKTLTTPTPAVQPPVETTFRTTLAPTPQTQSEQQQIEALSEYEAPKDLSKESFTVTIPKAEPKEDYTSKIKSELTSILQDPSKSGTIELFNTNVILESTEKFNKTFLQNYPSTSNSIYTTIKNFYENRIPATLGDLQILLTNVSKKSFLTSSQKSEAKRWLAQVQTEIKTALENILKDSTKSGAPDLLNTNVVKAKDPYATPITTESTAIFNQTYLQNFPSPSNSIYTAIKKFYDSRTPNTLGDLQTLLINVQNKNFLTASQNAEAKKLLTQIKLEVKNLLNSLLEKATTPMLLNVDIVTEKTGIFNQAHLQNYPSVSNSIYSAIKKFYETRTTGSLISLQTLLTNAQNKNFLTASQNASISAWLEKITQERNIAQTGEIKRVNKILKSLSGKTFDIQFSVLQKLVSSANPIYDYTASQQDFSKALQNLHNARPKRNSTVLQGLQIWYGTLRGSQLVSSEFNFTEIMSDVESDINKLLKKSTEYETTGVDYQLTNEINKILSKPDLLDKISGLKDVANNLGSQQASSETVRLFASSIMSVVGNDLNKIISAYRITTSEASKSPTLTTAQKNRITNLINFIKKFQQQLGQDGLRYTNELFNKSIEPSFNLLNQAQKDYVTDPLKRTLDNLPYILNDLNKILGQ